MDLKSGHRYKITNLSFKNTVIDLAGDSNHTVSNYANIPNGPNQLWTVSQSSGGFWQFTNVWAPEFGLASDSNSTPNTVPSKVVAGASDNWVVYPDPQGKEHTYIIYYAYNLNRISYYVTGGSSGTPISLSSTILGDSQKWLFEEQTMT